MAFIEERLLDCVERGADGGPAFSVTIFELANGFEARNANWSQDRRSFDVSYGITSFSDLEAVVNAFHAVGGNLDGFRFKDWSQYTIGDAANVAPQLIGTGDAIETTFQATKLYEFGSASYSKTILKLVAGTVGVYIDTGGGYALDGTASVNLNTGVVTPTATPGVGDLVGLIAEYDIPVRFNVSGRLNLNSVVVNSDGTVSSIPNVDLVEIRIA